jgi:phosphatidylethanolamine-binding protein (PEBP) family uncharacterized protein
MNKRIAEKKTYDQNEMKRILYVSCLLLITNLSLFSLGNQETQLGLPIEISSQGIFGQEPDYEKIAAKLGVNVEDLIQAFEESESKPPLDLKTIATKLKVTEKELREAMGPPPDRAKGQDSQHPPKGSGKIFSSLTADYGNPEFEIASLAIENGEILDDYTCEKKIDTTQKSIPLSWDNIPEGTKSLAIVMYHYPNPDDRTNRNSYLLLWGIDPTVTEIAYGEADKGKWYMGQNKDGDAISYTSPCSKSPGIHEYTLAIFALAEYPELLPKGNSLDVDFDLFMTALEKVEIVGRADLVFKASKK